MNQFATDPDPDPSYTIEGFNRDTPSGHQETIANCPTGTARRPMFGHGGWSDVPGYCVLDDPNNWVDFNGDGITEPTYIRKRVRKVYVFWIGIANDYETYPAWGCS